MGILARGAPPVNPLHRGCVESCCHVELAAQYIAHLLGSLFHGEGQVLHSHLDFSGELLACSLELKVVFALCIPEFNWVAFITLPLVVEGQFIGSAKIVREVTRVLLLSLNFKDYITQELNLFLEFEIYE